MKRIAWVNPDTDVLAICVPNYNCRTRPAGETDDEFLARLVTERVPDGVSHIIFDDTDAGVTDFLAERTFRNGWSIDGSAVVVDMAKARVIHMDAIRKVRNKELAAKDITFMRAVEAGDTDAQSTIGTEKQVLRDIPATFDITTDVDTPEKLKGKWPTELPARE